MHKTRKLKHEIDESTVRLQALEAELAALPSDHADDERAALRRRITAEQQLLERLRDIQQMAGTGKISRTRVLLTVAVLLAFVLAALFALKVWAIQQ